MEFFIEDKEKAFLIDDDAKNCEQAVRAGFNAIIVDKANDVTHLQTVINLCSSRSRSR